MTTYIDDLTIDAESWPDEFGHQYIWRCSDVPTPDAHSGSDEGHLLVCLDVDGVMDIVYADLGQSGDIAALSRAIIALEVLRNGLISAYGGGNRPGRCFAQGDWGRCKNEHDHRGQHRFPTESESLSLLHPPKAAVS